MKRAFCLLAAVSVLGCGKQSAQTSQEAAPPTSAAPSAVHDVTFTMLQGESIRAGIRTKEKIKAVAAQHNADLQEVQGSGE